MMKQTVCRLPSHQYMVLWSVLWHLILLKE